MLALVLLISMGGEGIVIAPVTIPILYWRARQHRSRTAHILIAALAALTASELTWGIVYKLAGDSEPKPWIWVMPVLAALSTVALFLRIRSKISA